MARDEINAFLGAGTTYEGKLSFQGSVRIDGNFDGEIESEGTLVVGKDAKVQGTLRVGQLVVSGHLQGEVRVAVRCIFNKQARFSGSLEAPVLVVEEGAEVRGRINIDESREDSENAGDEKGGLESGKSREVLRIANT